MENNSNLPEMGIIEFPDYDVDEKKLNDENESNDKKTTPQVEDLDNPNPNPNPTDRKEPEIIEEQKKKPETETVPDDDNESEKKDGDSLTDDELLDLKTRHFNAAKQLGYLDLPEDYQFDGNLEEAYQKDYEQKVNKIQQYIVNQMPDEGKEIMNYLLQGGKDITTFLSLEKEQIDIASIDVSTDEGAEKIITQYFKNKDIDPNSIQYAIEGYKDSGKLQDQATKIKDAEVARLANEKKTRIEQEIKEQALEKRRLEEYSNTAAQYLRETPWKNDKKQQVFSAMFSQVEYNGENKLYSHALAEEIFKNPKAAAVLTDFLLQYDLDKGEFDLSRYRAVGSSETIRQVENNLDQLFSKPKSNSTEVKEDNLIDWDLARPATTLDYEQLNK